MTREQYVKDQQNGARQSGTAKGKQAVRDFLAGLEERFSDGAEGSATWNAGPLFRLQLANNYFLKWLAEIPPWGTPEHNAAIVTMMMYPGLPVHTVWNLFGETEADLRYRIAVLQIAVKVMKAHEQRTRRELRQMARDLRRYRWRFRRSPL